MSKEKSKPTVEIVGVFSDFIDGHGNITTRLNPEQVLSFAEQIAQSYSTEAQGAGCVCIDGRNCVHMLDSQGDVRVMSKIAGGNGLAVWTGAELAQTSLIKLIEGTTPKQKLQNLVQYMGQQGEEVYGHSSTQATETNNECGAAMKLMNALEIFTKQPEAIGEIVKSLMEDEYSQHTFDAQTQRAAEWLEELTEGGYKGTDLTDAIVQSDQTGAQRIEVLSSDDSETHNHLEEFVIIDTRPGITIDRDRIVDELGIEVFSVDVDAIDGRASKYSIDPTHPEDYLNAKQAIVTMQVATYLALCDGSHPIVLIS